MKNEIIIIIIIIIIHCCFCDVVLRSLLFLWCWLLFFIHCFLASSLTLLWAIARILHPFYTFSPAHRRVICDTFILTFPGPSFTVLLRVLPFWVGIFYPQAFFTLHSFPTFLPQPAFIKASLGAGSSSLKFAGFMLILKTQTTPIYLFDSQQSTILIFRRIRI